MFIKQQSHKLYGIYLRMHLAAIPFGFGHIWFFHSLLVRSKLNSVPPNWDCSKSYLQQVRYYWFKTSPQNLTSKDLNAWLKLESVKLEEIFKSINPEASTKNLIIKSRAIKRCNIGCLFMPNGKLWVTACDSLSSLSVLSAWTWWKPDSYRMSFDYLSELFRLFFFSPFKFIRS